MNDAFVMRRGKRIGNLNAEIEQLFIPERLARHAVLQRLALEILHRDKKPPAVLANFVNRANARMIERRSRASFAPETFERDGIFRDIIRKELQRNRTAEIHILGFVNDAHAAAAEFLENPVVRKLRTGARCPG